MKPIRVDTAQAITTLSLGECRNYSGDMHGQIFNMNHGLLPIEVGEGKR
jgi:hypothetical protein